MLDKDMMGPSHEGKQMTSVAHPDGGSLVTTPDQPQGIPPMLPDRPPVVGTPWKGKGTPRVTRTKLADRITEPDASRQYIDKIGRPDDNAEFVGNLAVEAVREDPEAQAMIINLSPVPRPEIAAVAERRGIVTETEVIQPKDNISTRPDQIADVIAEALPGKDHAKERGVVREVAGALEEINGRQASLPEIQQALQYLDRRSAAIDATPDGLKDQLNLIYGSGRARISEDGTFRNILDGMRQLADSGMHSRDKGPQDAESPLIVHKPQIVVWDLPAGAVSSQREVLDFMGGRTPQLIRDNIKDGPAFFGLLDGHAFDAASLQDVVDATESKRVGLTVVTFDPTRTSREMKELWGGRGTIVVSRATAGGTAAEMSDLVGKYQGTELTGYSAESILPIGQDGPTRDPHDDNHGTTKHLNYQTGQIPRVRPSTFQEMPAGRFIAVTPEPGGLSVDSYHISQAAVGPQALPMREQLQEAIEGVPVQLHSTPKAIEPPLTRPIELARYTAARSRAERTALKAAEAANHPRNAPQTGGLRYGEIITNNGDVVIPPKDVIAAMPPEKQKFLTQLAHGSDAQREAAILALGKAAQIPFDVVTEVIARDKASQSEHARHQANRADYERDVARYKAFKDEEQARLEQANAQKSLS